HLWVAGLDGGTDLLAPLQTGKPLHDYLHEELLEGTLPEDGMGQFRGDLGWLVGPGPLRERPATPDQRWAMDMLIPDPVGVLPGRGGWCLHPLVSAFFEMHVPSPSAPSNVVPIDAEASPRGGGARVAISTLGGLAVAVDGVAVPETAWPTAAR